MLLVVCGRKDNFRYMHLMIKTLLSVDAFYN